MSFIGERDRLEHDYGNAFLLAVAGAALATALGVVILTLAEDSSGLGLAALAVFLLAFIVAFVIIGLAALVVGLPLTWFLARNRLEQPWTYPLAGLSAGAALVIFVPVLSGDLRVKSFLEFLPYAPVGAVPGCLCGAIWWWIYRRHMQE